MLVLDLLRVHNSVIKDIRQPLENDTHYMYDQLTLSKLKLVWHRQEIADTSMVNGYQVITEAHHGHNFNNYVHHKLYQTKQIFTHRF
jgi:hypothetical protein